MWFYIVTQTQQMATQHMLFFYLINEKFKYNLSAISRPWPWLILLGDLKCWKTGSPESQLEEKWTGPWDILLTTPILAGIKPWINHTIVKKALEEQWTTKPQGNLKVIFWKQWHILFITFCLTPCYGELIPFKQDENIWVYLAKYVLNISDFCLAGETSVELSLLVS